MHVKRLLTGIKAVTTTSAGIAPFILGATATLKGTALIASAAFIQFTLISSIVYYLGKWFRKSELAVLTLAISGFMANIYVNTANTIKEMYLIVMVISFCYLISNGTDNFNKRLSFSWCFGAAIGLAIMALIIGFLRFILPDQPGYAFFAAAITIAISRRLFKS
jgi:hypothetical protein